MDHDPLDQKELHFAIYIYRYVKEFIEHYDYQKGDPLDIVAPEHWCEFINILNNDFKAFEKLREKKTEG